MSSLNKVILIGRLGKDPDFRTMQSGDDVVSFSLATSEKWKDKSGEWKEKTEWHNVVSFNKGLNENFMKRLSKGSMVYLEGSIATRSWESDGQKKWTTEIVLKNFNGKIMLLDKFEKDKGEYDQSPVGESEDVDDLEDEIPF